jgi:hypothetical protein
MSRYVLAEKIIRSPMLYPAELRAHQCFQSLSQEPKFLGTDQAPKMTAEKYFRQLRLPELARRSYPKKTPPAGVPDELADSGNRRFKALKPENANYRFFATRAVS